MMSDGWLGKDWKPSRVSTGHLLHSSASTGTAILQCCSSSETFWSQNPLHSEKLLQTQRALIYICRLCILIFLSISVYCIRNLNWGIFFFQPYCVACGILVPWPEIKPVPPELEGRVLTTGPVVKSSVCTFIIGFLSLVGCRIYPQTN